MKSVKIGTDLYEEQTIKNEKQGDYCFLLLKSPASAVFGGKKVTLGVNTAVVLGKEGITIKPLKNGARLQYDCLTFGTNAFGSQYLESLGIPIDTPFEIGDDTVIRSIIRCVEIQEFSDESKKNGFRESAVHMLLLAIGEQAGETASRTSDAPHYRELSALRNSIYADPVREWSIDEICKRLNISSTYFHRIYFAAFGTTFRQDVISSRIALAEKLLVNTGMTVGSIAEQCGYDNDSYFMRQFKQHRGYTPSEFRRKFAKKDTGEGID